MREMILAIIGAIAITVGVGMVYVPAGVVVAGVALIVFAYVARYLKVAQHEDSGTTR